MIDYIDIIKHLTDKDTISLVHLQEEASYCTGWIKYYLEGCRKVEVWINKNLSSLRLKGSIMYFYQGHNFAYSRKLFVEAINYIEKLLKCDLWSATVETFEFGVILEAIRKPKDYIQKHKEKSTEKLIMNEKNRDKGSFRWWTDKKVKIKMYDAGKNIQHKQGTSMKQIIVDAGWNPNNNYIKMEVHYIKPHQTLNKGAAIQLANLVNPKWESIFKEDLFVQYQRLSPMKNLILPTEKKDISTADIIMIELVESKINEGCSIHEIKKMLYGRINTFTETLSENDKKARKRQIKALIDKLSESDISEWDLSNVLSRELFQDSE